MSSENRAMISKSARATRMDMMRIMQAIQLIPSLEEGSVEELVRSSKPLVPRVQRLHQKTSVRRVKATTDDVIVFNTEEVISRQAHTKGKVNSLWAYNYSSSGIWGAVSVSKNVKRGDEPENETQTVSISFRPALLLSRQQFAVRLRRKAYSGWDFAFRVHCVLPESDDIFHLCKHGTADDLNGLFRSRSATPFSCDQKGWSLLHVRQTIIIVKQADY